MTRKDKLVVFGALVLCTAIFGAALLYQPTTAEAGLPATGRYQVLSPITRGNLTIFPVVASTSHDTHEFLTLDEGLRNGEVEVTEHGGIRPMVRRHNIYPPRGDGAQVNRLYLINNSKRPLLLLAGEIVAGGRQDRIVGKDRIVPADTEADLDVFCVEPGRWTGTTASFGAVGGVMAAPSIRNQAMAKKDQNGVWNEVNKSNAYNFDTLSRSAPAARAEVGETSSYAKVMDNKEVQRRVDTVAAPIQHSYEHEIHELRDRNAVGVVVAVNGRIIWADLFASTSLLEKYWPKLVRSYASEALYTSANAESVSVKAAQEYLDQLGGRREISESEPGVYRHTEIIGDGYKAFELTSLLPSTGFDVHISKMTE